jgi:hypothetical protein
MNDFADLQQQFIQEMRPAIKGGLQRTLSDVPTGYRCHRPIDRDTPRGRFRVACYTCTNCLKGRRQDLVGRVTAEAMSSHAVYFITLTYSDLYPGPEGVPWVSLPKPREDNGAFQFRKQDWTRAYDRLRKQIERATGTKMKVLYAFERGERKTRRVHIHAIIMLDGVGWPSSSFFADRDWLAFWPWGHCQVVKITGSSTEIARRVRYVAKYTLKTYDIGAAPCGWSKIDLATSFLVDLAQQHVDQGLQPQGYYNLPGVTFTGGDHAGKHCNFYLRGSAARIYAKAYREKVEAKFPDLSAFALPWQLTADDEAIDPIMSGRKPRLPVNWHPHSELWKPKDCTASRTVANGDGTFIGILRLDSDGLVSWHPQIGPPQWLGNGATGAILAKTLPEATPATVADLVAWAAHQRGSGWRPPEVREAERAAVMAALGSRDIGSKLGGVIASAIVDPGAADGSPPKDPLGLPANAPQELRLRVLAARLRDA